MNTRKMLALGLAGVMAASVAVPVAAEEREKITISSYVSDANQIEVREKYFDDALREAFPDVDFEFKIYADKQQLQVEVAGGGGPDILDLDGPADAVQFAKSDRILPLDEYSEKYGWKDLFYDWAYNSSMYNDQLYSLPNGFGGMLIWYNMDVLEANGWEIPQTLDELNELMPKMVEAGIMPIAFGNGDYQGAIDWHYSTILSCYGGPETIKSIMDGEDSFATNEDIRNAMQLMIDWWQNGYITEKNSMAVTMSDAMTFFASGKAAMMITGTWTLGDLTVTYPDVNWKACLLPTDGVHKDIFPLATAGGYAINAKCENPDLAAEVLNYLFTSEERHYAHVNEAGGQPYPLKSFDVAKLQGLSESAMDMYQIMDDAMSENRIGYCSWTFFPAEMRAYMNENTDSLYLDALSLDEYLEKCQTYIDAAIEDGSMPVLP